MGKQQKLEQVAYFYIKEQILNGTWESDDHIIESSISNVLDISRSPIRAALAVLEKEGVVSFIPYRGYYVAENVDMTDDIGFYLVYSLVLWYRLTDTLQKRHVSHLAKRERTDQLIQLIAETIPENDAEGFRTNVEHLLTHLLSHAEKPLYVDTLLRNYQCISDHLIPEDRATSDEQLHRLLVREFITFSNIAILFKENRFIETRVLVELLIRFFAGQLLDKGLISQQYSPYTIH